MIIMEIFSGILIATGLISTVYGITKIAYVMQNEMLLAANAEGYLILYAALTLAGLFALFWGGVFGFIVGWRRNMEKYRKRQIEVLEKISGTLCMRFASEQQVICPSCGTRNLPSRVNCRKCGETL